MQVLAVDDDPQDLRYIRDTLVGAGYQPVITRDPQEAVRLMERERPHLALLDLVLPYTGGIYLMQDILRTADVPVFFLSTYERDETKARASEMGAMDYVVKPLSPTEFVARMASALSRREAAEQLEPFVLGEHTINYLARLASIAGRQLHLTTREYRGLAELSVNEGKVLTYEHLLQRV